MLDPLIFSQTVLDLITCFRGAPLSISFLRTGIEDGNFQTCISKSAFILPLYYFKTFSLMVWNFIMMLLLWLFSFSVLAGHSVDWNLSPSVLGNFLELCCWFFSPLFFSLFLEFCLDVGVLELILQVCLFLSLFFPSLCFCSTFWELSLAMFFNLCCSFSLGYIYIFHIQQEFCLISPTSCNS